MFNSRGGKARTRLQCIRCITRCRPVLFRVFPHCRSPPFPLWSGGLLWAAIFFRSVCAKSGWVVQQNGEKRRLFPRNENTTSINRVGVDIEKQRALCGLWSDQKDPLDPLSSSLRSLIDFIGYIGKETCIYVQISFFFF